MAIRRPPTTFSDTISTADIADDAISGDKLANDIAISTTGNIATTGSGVITSPIIQTDSIKDDSGTRVLASDSGSAWSWGSGVPAGSVIQVVNTVNGTANLGSTASDYPVATGFKLSITPKYQTSKILVIFNVNAWISDGTNSNKISKFGIRLNSQSNQTVADKRFSGRYLDAGGDLGSVLTLMYLDDHNSTNSQEYELVLGRWSSVYNNSVMLNGGGFGKSTITLMEIA